MPDPKLTERQLALLTDDVIQAATDHFPPGTRYVLHAVFPADGNVVQVTNVAPGEVAALIAEVESRVLGGERGWNMTETIALKTQKRLAFESPNPSVDADCVILDRAYPGWADFADLATAPSDEWRAQANARRDPKRDPKLAGMDAEGLIASYLASCLPEGVPPVHRAIFRTRFRGTGRRCVAVADVVMFDGLGASVEVFRWGVNAFGHRWLAMEGGAAYFEDDRWQREEVAGGG